MFGLKYFVFVCLEFSTERFINATKPSPTMHPLLLLLLTGFIQSSKLYWHPALATFHSEVKSLSLLRLSAAPWTVAHQASPSVEFSRHEYWSGLPFPSPGNLPDPGIEPGSPALQADALPSEPRGNHRNYLNPEWENKLQKSLGTDFQISFQAREERCCLNSHCWWVGSVGFKNSSFHFLSHRESCSWGLPKMW